jgi:hypothetical protein
MLARYESVHATEPVAAILQTETERSATVQALRIRAVDLARSIMRADSWEDAFEAKKLEQTLAHTSRLATDIGKGTEEMSLNDDALICGSALVELVLFDDALSEKNTGTVSMSYGTREDIRQHAETARIMMEHQLLGTMFDLAV